MCEDVRPVLAEGWTSSVLMSEITDGASKGMIRDAVPMPFIYQRLRIGNKTTYLGIQEN